MQGRDSERVGRTPERGPESAHSAVAEVIQAQVGWIVDLVVGSALNIPRASERRIDIHGIAARCATVIGKGKLLVVLGSGETAARTKFTRAGARNSIATQAIALHSITCG